MRHYFFKFLHHCRLMSYLDDLKRCCVPQLILDKAEDPRFERLFLLFASMPVYGNIAFTEKELLARAWTYNDGLHGHCFAYRGNELGYLRSVYAPEPENERFIRTKDGVLYVINPTPPALFVYSERAIHDWLDEIISCVRMEMQGIGRFIPGRKQSVQSRINLVEQLRDQHYVYNFKRLRTEQAF